MILIETSYMQQHFPLWARYCINATTKIADVTILEDQRDRAQNILLGFIGVDETTMTDPLREHLFNIVKYLCFGLKHGDTEFKSDPQIVKDYKDTYKLLLSFKNGEIPVDSVMKGAINKVSMKSKPRIFGTGFGPGHYFDINKRGLE